jgi:3-keto-disaccharide hydrolase
MKKIIVLLALGLSATFIQLGAPYFSNNVEAGFQSLFNGKDLTGWEGNMKFWTVKDAAITGQTTQADVQPGKMTYLVWKGGEVKDFELRLSFRFEGERVNTGVSYRGKNIGNWVVTGYQADIESGNQWNGILVEMEGRRFLGMRGQKTVNDAAGKMNVVGSVGDPEALDKLIKRGEWNDYVIIAKSNRLIHKINGQTMTEVIDDNPEKRALSGVLAFQLHHSYPQTVQFKDVRIKMLK